MRAIFWPAEDESMDKIIIRPMTPEDWSTVSRIYVEGIATEYATFQTECPPYTAWDASHTKECRLVILSGGVLAGWCAWVFYTSVASDDPLCVALGGRRLPKKLERIIQQLDTLHNR